MLGWKRRVAIACWVGLVTLNLTGAAIASSTADISAEYSFGSLENGAAPGFCSSDGWCWRNPLPQGNWLNGVWGSGAGDVWTVGRFGTILHWDGSAWTSIPSGTPATLYGVWGSGAGDVWAVGYGGIILHWDGSA
jgi:hypothetical protein